MYVTLRAIKMMKGETLLEKVIDSAIPVRSLSARARVCVCVCSLSLSLSLFVSLTARVRCVYGTQDAIIDTDAEKPDDDTGDD